MAPFNRLRLGDTSNGAYELIDRPRKDQDSKVSEQPLSPGHNDLPRDSVPECTQSPSDKDWTRDGKGLPAKRLPIQIKAQNLRLILIVSFLSALVIIGLSVLLSQIQNFEPYTDEFVLAGQNALSCDLMASNQSAQTAFVLNLRGNAQLTYAEAKIIDVLWLLFVGAGGRFLLAWLSYLVFMDGFTRLLEQTPVSYEIYASVTFQTHSVLTTFYVLKAVFSAKGWRGKTLLAWFVLSSIYVLGFPTLMSAAGGYVTPSTSMFAMPDGSLITPDSPTFLSCYNVTGGRFVGFPTNNSIAYGPPVKDIDVVDLDGADSISSGSSSNTNFDSHSPPSWTKDPQYAEFLAILNYTLQGQRETITYVATNTSTSPQSQGPGAHLSYNRTTDFFYANHTYHLYSDWNQPYFLARYCYNNQTIDSSELKALAKCQPTQYFVWGLSSLLVKVVLGVQIFWTLAMYGVWLDANLNGILCRHNRRIRGPFRAAADLGDAMREALGDNICAYSDSALARELSHESGVRYYTDAADDKGTAHIGLSSVRIRKVHLDDSNTYG